MQSYIKQKNNMDVYIFVVSCKKLSQMQRAIYSFIIIKRRIIYLVLKLFPSWLIDW